MKVVIDGKLVDGGSGGGGGGTTPPLTDVLSAGDVITESQGIKANNGSVSYPLISRDASGWHFRGEAVSAKNYYTNNGKPSTNTGTSGQSSDFSRGDHTHPYDRYLYTQESSTSLQDHAINMYTGTTSAVTFTLPQFPEYYGILGFPVLDLIVDIDNSGNTNDLTVSFANFGTKFWIATTDEDISKVLTIEKGKTVRMYITQTNFFIGGIRTVQISTQEVFISAPGYYTEITFQDGTTQTIKKDGKIDQQTMIDEGLYVVD